jgi:hypothetical protein
MFSLLKPINFPMFPMATDKPKELVVVNPFNHSIPIKPALATDTYTPTAKVREGGSNLYNNLLKTNATELNYSDVAALLSNIETVFHNKNLDIRGLNVAMLLQASAGILFSKQEMQNKPLLLNELLIKGMSLMDHLSEVVKSEEHPEGVSVYPTAIVLKATQLKEDLAFMAGYFAQETTPYVCPDKLEQHFYASALAGRLHEQAKNNILTPNDKVEPVTNYVAQALLTFYREVYHIEYTEGSLAEKIQAVVMKAESKANKELYHIST